MSVQRDSKKSRQPCNHPAIQPSDRFLSKEVDGIGALTAAETNKMEITFYTREVAL